MVNTSFKILNSNNSTISSLCASKTIFKTYQYKPLMKFFGSGNQKILIADEVGLGKTIEAGHIMLEMKARNKWKNVLVVSPKSLLTKWQTELEEKFDLKFKIYENLIDLINDLHERDGSVRCIINYEKLRKSKKVATNIRKDIFSFIEKEKISFSLIVCDESHILRNKNTNIYNGIQKIIINCEAAVFMSATPIMLSNENLFNQLQLLDNQRYYEKKIFENSLKTNEPFIHALSEINNGVNLKVIADHLNNATVRTETIVGKNRSEHVFTIGEYFKDIYLYQDIINKLNSNDDSHELRASIQYNLSTLSPMNNIFSRTRKREVIEDWSLTQREPHDIIVKLSEPEQKEFDEVYNEYSDASCWSSNGTPLGLLQKKLQIASSVYGYLNNTRSLDNGQDEYSNFPDAKFNKLVEIIHEVFTYNKKIIIFAWYKKTIKYLSIRLNKENLNNVTIHGGIDIAEREKAINEFKNNPNINVLISSKVGSEGLDLQFCSALVNYDLPWNPMDIEQRIGRIDRFGQMSPTINIYNFVVKDSIQEDVYEKLLKRIGIFKSSIGDIEAILDESDSSNDINSINFIKKLENATGDLYCEKLTEEEKQKRYDEIAKAIENKKILVEQYSENMDSITNDFYFRDEINKIKNNDAYVTDFELLNFVNFLIKNKLTTCSLSGIGNNCYELSLPPSNPHVLTTFLNEFQPVGSDNENLFKQFKNKIENQTRLIITFDQKTAFENKQIVYINLYNPLILACCKYFYDTHDRSQNTFCFSLPKSVIASNNIDGGLYFLAVYKITTNQKEFGSEKVYESLFYVLYNVERESVIDDSDIVNEFIKLIQTNGKDSTPILQSDSERISMIENLRRSIVDERDKYVEKYRKDIIERIETTKQLQLKQTNDYYNNQIQSMTYSLENNENSSLEGTIRLMEINIAKLKKKQDEAIKSIQSNKLIEMKRELLTLNQINII
jgi:superfamily II DNA or RNA helicase